jgi:DNA-binding FrmR family transcriptional regulator
MSEEGRDCEEILLQIKAVQSALKKVGIILVTEHIDHCIKDAISKGKGKEAVESLKETLYRSMDL